MAPTHRLGLVGIGAAEHFAQLKKGDLVYVEGKIRNRRWEQDGQTFYRTEIHLDTYRTLRRRADAPKKSVNGRKTKAA